MPTIRTLDGGTRTESMPDSNSAHEPSVGPQATMSLREIAKAFVKDPDADVVGVIHKLLSHKAVPTVAWQLSDEIINHVEGQK